MGTPARSLLEEHAGGVLGGRRLKAWTPGGSSTPMLTDEHLDVGPGLRVDRGRRLAARHRRRHRDGRDRLHRRGDAPARAVLRPRVLRQVHAVPRGHLVGQPRARRASRTGYGRPEDLPLLDDLGGNILFRASARSRTARSRRFQSSLKYFRDEYEAHIARAPLPVHRPAAPGSSRRRRRRSRPLQHRRPAPELALGGLAVTGELVTLTVDGKEVTVPKGTLIIRAAEQLGIEIPRFCDHPLLDPLGACRQCYVEIEGQRKLFTSCTTRSRRAWSSARRTRRRVAHQAQVANLEFLLLNHPLDCPICDRGGECPLQDQALAFGPGESRYIEPKRTYEKPIAALAARQASTASAACSARGARASATRSAATGSSSCSRGAPASASRSRRARTSARRSAATRCRSARSARSPPSRTGSSRARSTCRARTPSAGTAAPAAT